MKLLKVSHACGVARVRGCIRDVTKAFEPAKVKPIVLSALFSKVSPTAAALD